MTKHLFSEMDITCENITKWAIEKAVEQVAGGDPDASMLGELRNVLGRWHWQWLEQMSLNDLRETVHQQMMEGDDGSTPVCRKSQVQCLTVIMDEILPNVRCMGDVENMGQLIEEPPFRFEPAVYG